MALELPNVGPAVDRWMVFMTVMTDTGSTFVVGIDKVDAPDEVTAMQTAINAALTKGVKVMIVNGTPPIGIKPVAAVPFHVIKTSIVSIIGG